MFLLPLSPTERSAVLSLLDEVSPSWRLVVTEPQLLFWSSSGFHPTWDCALLLFTSVLPQAGAQESRLSLAGVIAKIDSWEMPVKGKSF